MNIRGFNELNQLGDESSQYEFYPTKMIVRAIYV
jgi:hypothetical protein